MNNPIKKEHPCAWFNSKQSSPECSHIENDRHKCPWKDHTSLDTNPKNCRKFLTLDEPSKSVPHEADKLLEELDEALKANPQLQSIEALKASLVERTSDLIYLSMGCLLGMCIILLVCYIQHLFPL
jgi:hypothetical protein